MDGVDVGHVQVLALGLFAIGAAGALLRRNALIVLISIELMLNAANLSMIGFARAAGDDAGLAFALLIIVLAAIELAVGLAIAMHLVRNRQSLHVDDFSLMRW